MTRACANCYFSHMYAKKGDQGFALSYDALGNLQSKPSPLSDDQFVCRRYPPKVSDKIYVSATDWCGEFEEKRHD